jgi:hypothetical protein
MTGSAHGLSRSSRFIVRRDGRYHAVTYLYPQQTVDIDALRRIVGDERPSAAAHGLQVMASDLRQQFFLSF